MVYCWPDRFSAAPLGTQQCRKLIDQHGVRKMLEMVIGAALSHGGTFDRIEIV